MILNDYYHIHRRQGMFIIMSMISSKLTEMFPKKQPYKKVQWDGNDIKWNTTVLK